MYKMTHPNHQVCFVSSYHFLKCKQWDAKIYAVPNTKEELCFVYIFVSLDCQILVPSTTCKIRVLIIVVSLLLPLVVSRSGSFSIVSKARMLWKLVLLGAFVVLSAGSLVENRSHRVPRDVDSSICDFKAGAKELVNEFVNQGAAGAEAETTNIEFDRFLCKVGITRDQFYIILAGVCAAIVLCFCIKKCLCCQDTIHMIIFPILYDEF